MDLRALSEMSATHRAFLSLYLPDRSSLDRLPRRFRTIRKLLAEDSHTAAEREHFEHNVEAVENHLKENRPSGPICIFSAWASDFLKAIPLPAPTEEIVRIGSSPYLRPLADLQDEYETVAVVIADNRRARVYLVAADVSDDEITISGNVKNHVKKGGWSQKRYQRRRDKELKVYAGGIVDALKRLDRENSFKRIVMVGGKEILRIVDNSLPSTLAGRVVGKKAVHLGAGDDDVNREIGDFIDESERESDRQLWSTIEEECLSGGLGTIGLEDTWQAIREGRVDTAIISRTYKPQGTRCRKCDQMHLEVKKACDACASESVYEVGIVNELVKALTQTAAEVEFTDPIKSLTESGHVAALLRY